MVNSEFLKILSVREMRDQDIDLVADYWLKSDPDFLVSLGVDLTKLPERGGLESMLQSQIQLPYKEKQSLALIWEMGGEAIGHCNVNGITFGKEATMHLHLWKGHTRQKGIGSYLVLKSLPIFFEKLNLETIWCEPYALNLAPNKTLLNVGFEFVKRYTTIPGSLNFEQEVNRYRFMQEWLIK